jgi:hypothetical protein
MPDEITLDEKEISQLRAHIRKIRTWLSKSDFRNDTDKITVIFKDKVRIEITESKDSLKCMNNCDGGCRGSENEHVFVCQHLSPKPELMAVEKARRAQKVIKVDGFTYKLQPNNSGKLYWYIQFTFEGKTETRYLGSAEPFFIPAQDLKNITLKKKEKERRKSAIKALAAPLMA